MTQQQTVSVIIPAFNEEAYIGDCIQAVKAQTYPVHEVIVVDNNSVDATAEIAEKFSGVKIVKESKQGLVYARNAGFRAATGDLLVRIDADTILRPDWIEKAVSLMAKNDRLSAITGRGVFYDEAMPVLLGKMQAFYYQFMQYPAVGSYTLWGANMMIRRDVAINYVCSDIAAGNLNTIEDVNITLRLVNAGKKVGYSPKLKASMSLRRGKTGIRQVIAYTKRWPVEYWENKRYLGAVYVGLLWLGLIVAVAVMQPFAKAERSLIPYFK